MQTVEKPARRSQAERTEQSDRLMLDAATDLIIEVGTQKTTLKDIGERAGYSRGLANARFGSKDQLFLVLSERCRRRWLRSLNDASAGRSGRDLLISRLDATLGFSETHPKEGRIMYILWFESVGTESKINKKLAEFHRAARADIKRIVLDVNMISGPNANERADRYASRFIATLFGLCYQWLVDEDAIDLGANLEDMIEEIVRQF